MENNALNDSRSYTDNEYNIKVLQIALEISYI